MSEKEKKRNPEPTLTSLGGGGWQIEGSTYNHRFLLRERGFVWMPVLKVWRAPTSVDGEGAFEELLAVEEKRKRRIWEHRSEAAREVAARKRDLRENGAIYEARRAEAYRVHLERGWPVFFPADGICHRCREPIFRYVVDPSALTSYIGGCPRCSASYDD